jgi:hypothetical protein
MECMIMRTRRPPTWWAVVLVLLLALWVGVTFFYRRGASGVSVGAGGGGSAISFDRQNDFALFKIDDKVGLVVNRDGSASVARYGRGTFPFCPLCGIYELQGSVVNLARYYRNGWVYTDYPGGPFAELYHVASGQTVDVARPVATAAAPAAAPAAPAGADTAAVASLPDYARRGLTFDEANRLTPARIQELFQPLAAINESCVVFNAAFMLLAAVWLIIALVFVIRGRPVA